MEKKLKNPWLTLAFPLICLTGAYAADAGSTDTPKTRNDVKAQAGPSPHGVLAAEAADSKEPVGGKSRAEVKDAAGRAARIRHVASPGPADAALNADSVGRPATAHAQKTRRQKRPHAAIEDGPAVMGSGSGSGSASGPLFSKIGTPTNQTRIVTCSTDKVFS